MYCYKCGEKVFPEANFCHHCGADLTVIRDSNIAQETSNKSHIKPKQDTSTTSQETKVFKMPLQEDDEALANYIKQVDENIQQEVLSREERQKTQEKLDKAQRKEQKVDAQPKKPTEKKRRSLRDMWNSFIDESDNPYSVFSQSDDKESFSSPKNAEQIKEENITLINEDTERTHGPSEDRFQTAGDISSLTRQVNEVLDQEAKKEQSTTLERPKVKEKSTEGLLKSFFKSFTKDGKADHKTTSIKGDLSKENKADKIESNNAKNTPEQAPENETLTEVESEKPTEQSNVQDLTKEETQPKKFTFLKTKTRSTTPQKSNKTEEKSKSTNVLSYLPLADVYRVYQRIIYKLLDYGQGGMAAIFIIGLLALVVPFFLIDTPITVTLILFMLIKILISFFTIYYAYLVASRNTGLYLDERRMLVYAGFNWSIVNLVLFIFFLFYPHDAAIGYNFLGALTPKLIPTILSYVIVSFFTLVSLYKDLEKDNYINFIGWFLTLYIGIDLAAKLFWVLIDFIFNSIL